MIIQSLAAVVAFLLSSWIAPNFEIFLRTVGVVGVDQQKKKKPVLTTSGGIIIAFGFLGSAFGIIALDTFYFNFGFNTMPMFAVISAVLVITIIGLLDDLHVKNEKDKEAVRIGLKQWQKPLLSFFAAVPLMVLAIGTSEVHFPILGTIDFGIIFPLVLVPLGLVFVSNAYNMLAGMNGLETGMGIVALSSLGIYAALNGEVEASIMAFAAVGASLAFILENWYPAKILPGDSLTYLLGAVYVSIAVVANIERFAALVFLPWIAEFVLKARGRFKNTSLGKLQKDGTLKSQYKKNYSLTHLVMNNGKFTEKQITKILIGAEILISLFAFSLYFLGFN